VHGTGLLIRLIFMVAVLRWGGASLLGQYSLLAALELVVIYLAGFEFHTFTSRRYAQRPNHRRLRLCAASHARVLPWSALVGVTAIVAAAWALGLKLTLLQGLLLALLVVSGSVAQEIGRLMILVGRPVHSVSLSFLRNTAWQPFFIGCLFASLDERVLLNALLMVWSASSILATAWGVWNMREALRSCARPRATYLLRGIGASSRFHIIASAAVLQGNLERFVLQSLLGPAAVGVFTFFQTLANTLPAFVQAAVLNVWLSRLLTAFSQRSSDRHTLVQQIARNALRVSLFSALAVCVAALPVSWLGGQHDLLGWAWMLPALLAAQVLLMWTQPLHLALFAGHQDTILMWLMLGSLLLAFSASVLFVQSFGIGGAVAAQLVAASVLALARARLVARQRSRGTL
jgi:O-antigen/teichoic acid export membrane protein